MKHEIATIIAASFWEAEAIKVSVNKPFTLTSGKPSPFYVDCRVLISYPTYRDMITTCAYWLCEQHKLQADYIAGGESAGIPFAAWLADRMKKPFIYVRKQPKGHGLTSQVEGKIEPGKTVLLYEDLITDGKSKLNFITGIRKDNCIVTDCLVVFDRQEGGQDALQEEGVRLYSLVTMDECLDVGFKNRYLSQEELELINAYRQTGEIR